MSFYKRVPDVLRLKACVIVRTSADEGVQLCLFFQIHLSKCISECVREKEREREREQNMDIT